MLYYLTSLRRFFRSVWHLKRTRTDSVFFRKINGKFVPYRYRTIIFGFVSSPFILNYVIQYHLSAHSSDLTSSLIRDRFYVNNLIITCNNDVMLSQYVDSIRKLMLEGGLPLREWVSNYPSALDQLSTEERSSSNPVKVLDYSYDVDWDALQLKQRSLNKEAVTKRQIASTLGSVFDPIGVFNPILMQSKLFIRSLCRAKVDWAQTLDEKFLKSWKSFCGTLETVSVMKFPRRTFKSDSTIKLCVFTDASKESYGYAFYVVQDDQRQAVSSVISDCIVCKRYNSPSLKYPGPAVLPSPRVKLSFPFAHTGVDYTGHYYVRNDKGGKVKTYILIFTCFNTRAIHLEAVNSMSMAEFILAFIRFVNRYGIPLAVYSDNAKSFLQSGGIIQNLLSFSEFEEKFRTPSISHKTIPVYAAWYGAVWERMIKTVKECFAKVIGRYTPYHSEFVTVLSDVQKVLNNRPLTYRSQENEVDVITPNHFLVGRPIPSLLFGDLNLDPEWEYYDEDYSSVLSKTIEWRDSVFRDFKDKWLKEYLLI